jgi:hypothetical protein
VNKVGFTVYYRGMKKYIVTTTINGITPAIEKFDNMPGWNLIVIGDNKTPKDYKLENGRYVSPEEQKTLKFESVKMIPWNLIQRRNIGYLLALEAGADIIATIDDDNIPYDNWDKSNEITREMKEVLCRSAKLVLDPVHGRYTGTHLDIWHRGFPVQLLEDRNNITFGPDRNCVDVVAGMWNGDPDVDAIARIAAQGLDLRFTKVNTRIAVGTFSPFNTQNTFLSRRAAMCMCLPFDIGRMDDIWASYMTQKVMWSCKSAVVYTEPTVYQDRNIHDLTKDLEKEMIGYKHTLEFITHLKELELNEADDVLDKYMAVVDHVAKLPFVSETMTKFQKAWIKDIRKFK